MLADHGPQQRHRHVRIVSGSQSRQFHEGSGVRQRRSVFHGSNDLLLARPDTEPHVERHDRAEQSAGVDQCSAIAEVADINVHRDDDCEKEEGNDDCGAKVVGETAFPQCVIDQKPQERYQRS